MQHTKVYKRIALYTLDSNIPYPQFTHHFSKFLCPAYHEIYYDQQKWASQIWRAQTKQKWAGVPKPFQFFHEDLNDLTNKELRCRSIIYWGHPGDILGISCWHRHKVHSFNGAELLNALHLAPGAQQLYGISCYKVISWMEQNDCDLKRKGPIHELLIDFLRFPQKS